ncbi:MAG: RNA polymerase sigma factor [Flavobacteriales bacterium]
MKKAPKHIKSLTDSQLVLLYKESHDKQCIGELYVRYSPLVMGVCIKYLKNVTEAQDTLMVIFEKLMKELKKTEVLNFKSWLYQITKNQCLMFLRKNKKYTYTTFDSVQVKDEESNEEELIEKEQMLEQLEEIIPTLKENQRICIELFYLNKKSYAEIAEQTQFSLKEVKSNIQNGKRNLELKLKKAGSNP